MLAKNSLRTVVATLALSVAATTAGVVGTAHAEPAPTAPVADGGAMPDSFAELRAAIDDSSLPPGQQADVREAVDAQGRAGFERLQEQTERLGLDNPVLEAAIARAIDPDDYSCTEDTALNAYADSLLAGLNNPTNLLILMVTGALDLPTYDAVFHGSQLPRHFLGGSKDDVVKPAYRKLTRFWDIRTDDIDLIPMTSSIYSDDERAVQTLLLMNGGDLGDPADVAQAEAIVQSTKDVFAQEPSLRNGDNAIFTLNAFAFTAEGETDPVWSGVGDKLAFGDGMFRALASMRTGGVGPQSVLGHEFGHHIQFERGAAATEQTPEATRASELMADGFAGYWANHRKGLRYGDVKERALTRIFYNIGDCSFDSPGHHGTPKQRRKAARWGLSYGWDSKKAVVRSRKFIRTFDAKLPALIRPDA